MAAALERSYIEICGFERETLHRFREVTVNLGKPPHVPLSVLHPVFFCSDELASGTRDRKRCHLAAGS